MAQAPARDGRDPDTVVIDDVRALKALAEPLRMRMLLEAGEQPRTVKELATSLGVPPTRLYYHVKILERHGFLHVASRRMVSGIEERSYQASALNWTLSPALHAAVPETGVLAALLDVVTAELELALGRSTRPIGDVEGSVPAISFTRFQLSPEDVAEVQRRLVGLMEEFGTEGRGPGKVEYNAFLTFYRAPDAP